MSTRAAVLIKFEPALLSQVDLAAKESGLNRMAWVLRAVESQLHPPATESQPANESQLRPEIGWPERAAELGMTEVDVDYYGVRVVDAPSSWAASMDALMDRGRCGRVPPCKGAD